MYLNFTDLPFVIVKVLESLFVVAMAGSSSGRPETFYPSFGDGAHGSVAGTGVVTGE